MNLIWIAILLLALLFEFLTPSALVSFWFAIGALFGLFASLLALSKIIQISIFFIVSLLALILLRPIVQKAMRGRLIPTGAESIIGKRFKLKEEITEDKTGQIENNGIIWSVKTFLPATVNKNELVEVVAIDGTKLIVRPIKEN